ncbi:MAG: hemerythrin family protein [Gammaproteobacteria bacterium]|jgi:ABC-type long-subunit fatty acid transport system fused permease/ATPase subunit|nr:hemerythrin family protein [Gammaproteobacteria bacterium]MBT3724947.1 hemerythrin family protein [Gammaproteobacteria bacterium]MBT4075583.1 hemerythrin family protein [Gammaproteobacteria bacterium]MBT4194344.1 hemerythrin family protein [Gammaproteobacteria bacterium]MBT4448596.1 hemerythrin family protein [Gammaproteobacteria bacterium]
MQSNKNALQKVSFYSAIISIIAAVACLVFLYLRVDDFGFENPISASLMAASFFFVSVGVVLMVIAKSNLPSFKINDK